MCWTTFALAPAFWATAALAQQQAPLDRDDVPRPPSAAPDQGRSPVDDRGRPGVRGGDDPSGSRRTFSVTIGSTIGTPIVSQIPERPR